MPPPRPAAAADAATARRDGAALALTALSVASMAPGVPDCGAAVAFVLLTAALAVATRASAWRGRGRSVAVALYRVFAAAAGQWFAARGRLLPVAVTSWPAFIAQRSLVATMGAHAATLRLADAGAPRLALATAAATLAVLLACQRAACAGILRGFVGADAFYAAVAARGGAAARAVVAAVIGAPPLAPPPVASCATARACESSSLAMFTAAVAAGTAFDFVAARRTTPRRAAAAVAALLAAAWTLMDTLAAVSPCPQPTAGPLGGGAPVFLSRAERLKMWPALLVAGVARACGLTQ